MVGEPEETDMSKPAFNVSGPFPRLSDELPFHDPRECHQCGVLKDLHVWQECDTADMPEEIYIVLCEKCAAAIIDPHPRLYICLEENKPAPGAMPICLNCVHRAGSICWHPLSRLRGGRGVKLDYPSPFSGFMDYSGKGGRRQGGPFTVYPGRVHNCSGKELEGALLPA